MFVITRELGQSAIFKFQDDLVKLAIIRLDGNTVTIQSEAQSFFSAVIDASNNSGLSSLIKHELQRSLDELEATNQRIKFIERQLKQFVDQDQAASILHIILSIGFLNASALAAKDPDPHQFDVARGISVHLGLTSKLIASGHKKQWSELANGVIVICAHN